MPTTYCNPISLPDYPLGKRARDVTVGAPVPADDSLWLVDKQQQYRELADVTVMWEARGMVYVSIRRYGVSKQEWRGDVGASSVERPGLGLCARRL